MYKNEGRVGMENTIHQLLISADERIHEESFMKRHRSNSSDFTRNRNLSFGEIMQFIICTMGTSLDFEVEKFNLSRVQSVTSSAISQARDKIQSSAFEEVFIKSANEIEVKNTYRGYRVTAYDGLLGELPRTPELMAKGQISQSNMYPQFSAVAEYDVLNCYYTNAILEIGSSDERQFAIELLKKNEYYGDEIILLDRGYPSLAMIQQLEKCGKKYVMRVSKSFLREVNKFRESSSTDEVLSLTYDKRLGATNRLKNVELPYSFSLRCVKIVLKSGETEVLVTNLPKDEFPRKDLGELYNLRWKIETAFLHLKYAIRIEDFIGVKENSIKQEFFASLFKANLFMQFINAADTIIFNKKKQLSKMSISATSGKRSL